MNDTDRWTKRALEHVRVLSKGIGPRGATDEAERRAAEYAHDELQRLGCSEVRLESFRGAVSTWMPWSIAFSLAIWGMLAGLLFGLPGGIIAAALYLLAAWIVYGELYPGGRSVRRWLWQADSQNVLAVIPPGAEVERRLVLMGYLDSARAPAFWHTRQRRRLAGCMVLPLLFSLPLNAALFIAGVITANATFYFLAFALSFPHIAALLVSLRAERSSFSPGANNNAAGMGTVLALAERLQGTPLARTEVWLLATGCRETGGEGVQAFLKTHGETLKEAIFVALEGVGVGERVVYLTGEGLLQSTHYSSEALALAARAAERCRQEEFQISAEHHRGGPTEMGLIARRGFKGLTANVWPDDRAGVAGRRRIDDTFDTIERQALARAHTFAWALLQEVDARQ